MVEKIELSRLVSIVMNELREEGVECRLNELHRDEPNDHTPVYEIIIDPEQKITFSNKEARLIYDPAHTYRSEGLNQVLEALMKDPDRMLSDCSCFVRERLRRGCPRCLCSFRNGENTESSLYLSKWIRYDQEGSDENDLSGEILFQQFNFEVNVNELRNRLACWIAE